MPLTVEEVSIYGIYRRSRTLLWTISFTIWQYKIGQLYMIARHSLEQSAEGEGVEVIENEPCEDTVHGKGQYTEKRIHLSRWDRERSQQMVTYLMRIIPFSLSLLPLAAFLTGYKRFVPACSMLQRSHGTIIPTQWQVSGLQCQAHSSDCCHMGPVA